MDSDEEDVIIACGAFLVLKEEEDRKRRKYWVHQLWRARDEEGEFHTIFSRLKSDQAKFFKYFRMSTLKFENLLEILRNDLTKNYSRWRRPVSPEEKLALTLKYLGSGNSQISLSFSYRLAPSTVNTIIFSTLEVIWKHMAARELPEPTEEMWKRNAEQFGSTWQFPNCLSAIDGKHVEIQAPQNSGSLYYNYKKTFSIVLLALVDANYKFVIIDVGGYGKSSDGGLLTKSILGKRLDEGTLNIPAPRQLPNSVDAYPYVIIGDEAFPLKTNLLRPYPGSSARDDERKKIYNYRLSRARRVVENAFGIMTQKFRIFYGRIHVNPENADKIVMAACVLHNYLRDENIPEGQFEDETESGILITTPLRPLRNVGSNYTQEALEIRERFCQYFNSIGAVPWQRDTVRRGRTTEDP